jgi:hypothetical protein
MANGVLKVKVGGAWQTIMNGVQSLLQSFVTFNPESSLTGSRKLTAGTNVTIDTATPGELSINATGVVGPVSSTDNAITRYDGVTGKLIQNSAASIDDSGVLTASGLGSTPLNASNLTSGTVSDARLSPNVALENVENTFTQNQTISSNTPRFDIIDTSQPVDQRVFELVSYNKELFFQALNDAQTVGESAPIRMTRAGDVTVANNLTVGNNLTVTGEGGNVALKTVVNTFTANQIISCAAAPVIVWTDQSQPANSRVMYWVNTSQEMILIAANDDYSTQTPNIHATRTGDVKVWRDLYEKQRSTPLGHWINVPFNAANFISATGAWNVDSVLINHYTLIGKTLIWSIIASGTLTASSSTLYIVIPIGQAAGAYDGATPVAYASDGTGEIYARVMVDPGLFHVAIYKRPNGNFTNGTVAIHLSITLQLV